MGSIPSKPSKKLDVLQNADPNTAPDVRNRSSNENNVYGSGNNIANTNTNINDNSVNNYYYGQNGTNGTVHEDARPPAYTAPSYSHPPRTVVFHGREEFVNEAVHLLTDPGPARLAIAGAGGMGKTSIAVELLYNTRVLDALGDKGAFISCEALNGADGLVGKLAEACGVPLNTAHLQTAVIAKLSEDADTVKIIVLDNLETVWLVPDSVAAKAVEDLLGKLAHIPHLSLVITCRGRILPPSVKWSNRSNAVLEPFSLEAALKTFEGRVERQLEPEERLLAEKLMEAVDRMPLAVNLLGQLAQRGTELADLVTRWESTHNAVLSSHREDRHYNVDRSIKVSVDRLGEQVKSPEPLQLLSLCSMLPDGLRKPVFEKLREKFEDIDGARQALLDYALATIGEHKELKVLSPIRHYILKHCPAKPEQSLALYSIFFQIALELPSETAVTLTTSAAEAVQEKDNLSSLLKAQIEQLSLQNAQNDWSLQQVVTAVVRLTTFASWNQPDLKLASALLPHLERQPRWKARCLQVIGRTQHVLGHYKDSIESLDTAAQLCSKNGDRSSVAWCKRLSGATHRLLGQLDDAEKLLKEALKLYVKQRDKSGEAMCRCDLGRLFQAKGDLAAAVKELGAARKTFETTNDEFAAAQCLETLGVVYRDQGHFDLAIGELDKSRSKFVALGQQFHVAQSARLLGEVRRRQRNFEEADKYLSEAKSICEGADDKPGLAECHRLFGRLRVDQGSREEAVAYFKSALPTYEKQGQEKYVKECKEQLKTLEPALKE